ncbi:MAG: sigma-70 family RNA polymerase sigma factor [Chloroflexi bacterium]|nr:sigma-70 family RNA polymerase sigma factor [Chloroflexota bacterium]
MFMIENPNDFIPTRRSLLTRLKNWDDQESWREFFDTYWKLIYHVALEAGLTESEAQEVVQETILTVARQFKEQKYHYDPQIGSFKGWLLHTTRWRIQDQFRKRECLPRNQVSPKQSSDTTTREGKADVAGSVPVAPHLEAVWDEEWQKNLMDAAIGRVRRQADPKLYQMFDLHVLRQWPADKVARKLHVNQAKVYYAKYKVSALIKREMRNLERKGI